MKENIDFLQAFLKNPTKVGSIAPSSPELALEMIKGIEPSEDNIILELGVGTGAITKHIADILPNPQSYIGIEIDESLVGTLNQQMPEMNVVCADACDAVKIHAESGLGRVKYVICGLPFVIMPAEISEKILVEATRFMEDGCVFRTFQYAHGYYMPSAIKLREFMRNRYGKSQRSNLVVKNMPPAYTLTWYAA